MVLTISGKYYARIESNQLISGTNQLTSGQMGQFLVWVCVSIGWLDEGARTASL